MNPDRVRLQRHLSVKVKKQPTSSPKARSQEQQKREQMFMLRAPDSRGNFGDCW